MQRRREGKGGVQNGLTGVELHRILGGIHSWTVDQMMSRTESMWTAVVEMSGTVDHGVVLSRGFLMRIVQHRGVPGGLPLLLQAVVVTG